MEAEEIARGRLGAVAGQARGQGSRDVQRFHFFCHWQRELARFWTDIWLS